MIPEAARELDLLGVALPFPFHFPCPFVGRSSTSFGMDLHAILK